MTTTPEPLVREFTIRIPEPPRWRGPTLVLWARVWAGQEPAESLPSVHRAALFRSLRAHGLTPAEIGAWTRTTEYTVRRILAA